MVKGTTPKTPVRSALVETSELFHSVADGLGALSAAHRDLFDREVRASFADSLDLDEAMKRGREEENRWDYLLGHEASGEVVAVEPHSAKDGTDRYCGEEGSWRADPQLVQIDGSEHASFATLRQA